MQNSSKVAPIWRRGTAIKTWTKYTGVLSGGYLYLFAKPKDPQPESYVWVRNSDF
jgi:vacuolar protein sorting-associated protein 13A/C